MPRRWRVKLFVGTLVALATVSVGLAAGSSVGKKTLGGRGYATDVTVAFTAPAGYTVPGGGYESWVGPLYTNLATGDQSESRLDFDVHPDFSASSAEQAGREKIGTDIGGIPTNEVRSGPIDVPHVIGGRKVGSIKGFVVIRRATRAEYEGWYEAAVAFSLGKGYPILAADIDTTAPGDDSNETIQGALPSAWNLQAVEEAVRGVAVEGNLAPSKVTARVRGGQVAGRVTDGLGHPVVGAKVALERGSGSTWKQVAQGKTNANGEFKLRLAGVEPGQSVRVAVKLAGLTVRSKALRP